MAKSEAVAEVHELDPVNPDPSTLAGVVIATRAEVLACRREVQDTRGELNEVRIILEARGRTLDKIAESLGIEPEANTVPPIRKELQSLHDVDKATLERVSTVEADQKVIKVSLVDGLPKVVKVLGAVAAALFGLATVLWQILAAVGRGP